MQLKHLFSVLFALLLYTANAQVDNLLISNDSTHAVTDTLDSPVPADPYEGLAKAFVYSVYDGDGCRVKLADGSIRKIRFYGCDSPEFKNLYTTETQPHAKQSRDSLRALILNKYVYLDTLPQGKVKYSYGRLIADVYTADELFIWVNHYIVIQGWAWNYKVGPDPVNPLHVGSLAEAQRVAKVEKVGLWALPGRKYSPGYWRRTYNRAKVNSDGSIQE